MNNKLFFLLWRLGWVVLKMICIYFCFHSWINIYGKKCLVKYVQKFKEIFVIFGFTTEIFFFFQRRKKFPWQKLKYMKYMNIYWDIVLIFEFFQLYCFHALSESTNKTLIFINQ